jgi:cytochrome c-type biogenesis protein CcmH/NrfG
MGQFADAIHSYSRAVELDPLRAEGLLGLAEAQASAGHEGEATGTLDAALQRFPKDARIKVLYASVLLKEGEASDAQANQRAEQMLRSALALDTSLPMAHYELGRLVLNEGRVPEAVGHLEEAAKLDPQSSSIHFVLARAYRRAGEKEKAAREMDLYEKLKREETQAPAAPVPALGTQNRF